MFTNDEFLEMANSFIIDPLFDVTLERRSENTWALVHWSRCLDKNTGEWEHESSPSNRTDNFISSTRFTSINDAVNHYAKWRKERCFIFCKTKADQRWNCFVYGEKEDEVRKSWEGFAKNEPGKLKRSGLWIFVGRDFKILETFTAKDGSAEGVHFFDRISFI